MLEYQPSWIKVFKHNHRLGVKKSNTKIVCQYFVYFYKTFNGKHKKVVFALLFEWLNFLCDLSRTCWNMFIAKGNTISEDDCTTSLQYDLISNKWVIAHILHTSVDSEYFFHCHDEDYQTIWKIVIYLFIFILSNNSLFIIAF